MPDYPMLPPGEQVPDGVHLGLPERVYFGQGREEEDCLGGSDVVSLAHKKHGWWWSSRHNRRRALTKKNDGQQFGTALHALVLEGPAALESRYIVEPEIPADAVRTIDEMKQAHIDAGFALDKTSSWKAGDWALAMATNLPDVPCAPNIKAEFNRELEIMTKVAEQEGRDAPRVISPEDYEACYVLREAALSHRDIADLLGEGSPFPPLAEVSVFKTYAEAGFRRRWRFDRVFPRFDFDLKSMHGWNGRPLKFAIGDHIARFGYDIGRADYDAGRRVLEEHVLAGRVYGGTPDQRAWLERLVRERQEAASPPDWVWLFCQRPSTSGSAPVVIPVWDEHGSDLHRGGAVKAAEAIKFYARARAEFGLSRPWTLVEPIHYTDERFRPEPVVSFPHWIKPDAEDHPDAGDDGE